MLSRYGACMRDAADERTQAAATLKGLSLNPIVVAWELTRACGYRCTHCRADAQPLPAVGELSPHEANDLVDALAGFYGTTLVLTGGDPFLRADLRAISERAVARGLRVGVAPSATPKVTAERLADLADAGVESVALSIDGAGADEHDAMRGIHGSFTRTLRILSDARRAGLRTQVNTTVTRRSVDDLERIAHLVAGTGVAMWSVFFLVPVGRGARDQVLSAHEHEAALQRLADLQGQMPYRLKVTEAPSYRRVLAQRGHPIHAVPPVNGGRGFMFISHDGNVCPSGFLPLVAGNVRDESPVSLYRDSKVFTDIRDPELLKGKCGACEFKLVCGGSRARARAMTGDAFAEDPTCAYQPASVAC